MLYWTIDRYSVQAIFCLLVDCVSPLDFNELGNCSPGTSFLPVYDLFAIYDSFSRPDRIRGTICFFFGIVLVLLRWGMLGIIVEGFGFLNLFGNFLPIALNVARQLPVISQILSAPGISQFADFIAGKTEPRYSV